MSKKHKDLSVELLRIIGALMVIGTHSKQGFFIDGSLSEIRVLLACLVGDGVAIFWIIAGFFFPGDILPKGFYQKNLKKSIKRILIPMISLTLFTFFFSGWLLDGQTLYESVHHTGEQYLELVKGFLQWKNVVKYAGHMWYMYTYFLMMVCIPMVWGLISWTRRSSKSWIVLFVLWFLLLLNDCFHNGIFRFSHYSINALAAAIIYVVSGSILYQRRDKFLGNIKTTVLGIVMFIIAILFRCHFQCEYLINNPDDTILLFWFTNFAYISIIGIVMVTWGCIGLLKNKSIFQNAIYHIGSRTMMIYLVHYLILQKTRNLEFPKMYRDALGINLYGSIAYQITYTLMVFVLSFIAAEIIYLIKSLCIRLSGRFISRIKV